MAPKSRVLRLCSWFFAVLMLGAGGVAGADTTATLQIGSATGGPGQDVQVGVTLSTAGLTIAAVQNDIDFDAQTPIAPAGGGGPDCTVNPAINKGASTFGFLPVGCTPGADCTGVRAVVLATDNVDPIADGSTLYTCRISIAPGAMPGAHPLTAANLSASDPNGQVVPLAGVDGSVVVSLQCVGDCDGDGHVTINEMVMGVAIVLERMPLSMCPAFDADDSGRVTVADLMRGVDDDLNGCPQVGTPSPEPTPPPPCDPAMCGGPCAIGPTCVPGQPCPEFERAGTCQTDASGNCACVPVPPPDECATRATCGGPCAGTCPGLSEPVRGTCQSPDMSTCQCVTQCPPPTATPPPAACDQAMCGGPCAIGPTCVPGEPCPEFPVRPGTCQPDANGNCGCVPAQPPDNCAERAFCGGPCAGTCPGLPVPVRGMCHSLDSSTCACLTQCPPPTPPGGPCDPAMCGGPCAIPFPCPPGADCPEPPVRPGVCMQTDTSGTCACVPQPPPDECAQRDFCGGRCATVCPGAPFPVLGTCESGAAAGCACVAQCTPPGTPTPTPTGSPMVQPTPTPGNGTCDPAMCGGPCVIGPVCMPGEPCPEFPSRPGRCVQVAAVGTCVCVPLQFGD